VSGFLVALILVAAPLSLGAEDGAEAAAAVIYRKTVTAAKDANERAAAGKMRNVAAIDPLAARQVTTGAAGRWERLGPWTADVSVGAPMRISPATKSISAGSRCGGIRSNQYDIVRRWMSKA
jgi:hypothetical protein